MSHSNLDSHSLTLSQKRTKERVFFCLERVFKIFGDSIPVKVVTCVYINRSRHRLFFFWHCVWSVMTHDVIAAHWAVSNNVPRGGKNVFPFFRLVADSKLWCGRARVVLGWGSLPIP